MNPDDFEKRLQREPIRRIPSSWRDAIVWGATAAPSSTLDPRPSFLSALLWPNPKAWAGLTAVWVLIFTIQFASRNQPRVMIVTSAAARMEVAALLKDQQVMLVELLENSEPREVDKPRRIPNQPHSERQNSFSTT